ncbi:MAG: zinc-ribbon domain-containing protein [Gaiellaceae bacterium]
MPDCPHCGSPAPAESHFCPECGRPLGVKGSETVVRPPSARLWPPDPYLVIVAALLAGAIILLVTGTWAWGLAALLGAAVIFLAIREGERRAAAYALGGVRARFSARRGTLAARSRGQIDLFRARRERAELEAERVRALQRLGHAVFYEGDEGIEGARAAVQGVVDRINEKEAEIQALIEHTDKRVQRAQAGVRPTEKLEAPPEPARIPEPWPPPDEGEPPAPAEVPEPSPDQPAPEPERPPTPQAKKKKRR